MREFHSLAEAALHLTKLRFEKQHGLMDEAAKIIQDEAKAIIGHYQTAYEPFGAWPELAESTKEQRVKLGFTENDPLLRTGKLRDSIERLASHDMAVVGSAEDEAVYQELGTTRIPPRSFLGIAAMKKGEEVANLIGEGIVGALVGGGGSFVKRLNRQ